MADTIIITAANASLGIPTVDYLLKHSPKSTLVLTVRNTSDSDANTNALRKVIAKYPNANTSIRQLDLAHLSAVHEFARSIAGEVAAGSLPRLSAIICTAYYWNLVDPLELTDDGFEKTIQVSYLSHTALILRLLGSFRNEGGRIIQFTSDGHEPGKNGLEQIPPKIPTDPSELDQVVKPPADDAATADALGHGFHRYARAKLAVVLWTHALNRRLQRDGQENLHNISAIAMNPGNLADSRALLTNTPTKLHIVSKFILRPFRPLLSMMDPTARTAGAAAVDVARLATNESCPGERGYFTLSKPDHGSKDSQDEATQDALWKRTAEWVNITAKDTALSAF